jgi:2'-5' RNA ligase
MGRYNLFFGLLPPAETIPYLTDEQSRLDLMNPVRPNGLHATMISVTASTDRLRETIERCRRLGNAVEARPFRMLLEEVTSGEHWVLARPVERMAGFDRCQREMAKLAPRLGLGRPLNNLGRPHVTLSYRTRTVSTQWMPPLGWPVTEFCLILSFVGESRYEIEGCWPLLA